MQLTSAAVRSIAGAILLLCICLLSSCPRDYPEGLDPQAKVTGTHPWDKPDYQGPELVLSAPNREPQPGDEQPPTAVEARPERGPALPEKDTLDIAKFDGHWLVVAITHSEQQELLPVSEQDIFIFQNGRSVIFHAITNWKDAVQQGSFKKLRPGVVGLMFGDGKFTEFYGMFFRDDFLYIWNYERKTGFWMVKLPKEATERMGANRFATSRGTMKFDDVVATSYSGKVTKDNGGTMTVSGFYNKGVLSMRWEEDDRTGTGFAAFVVGPEWKTLKGTWWIDDYEAVPFSDVWDGTRE